MKTSPLILVVAALAVAIISSTAIATPTLYDLTGQKTADGMGTLVGSYIYDPASNAFAAWNLGALYNTMPDFTDFHTYPQVTINPRPDLTYWFATSPIAGIIGLGDTSAGFMPLFTDGTPHKVSVSDSSWIGTTYAVRLNLWNQSGDTALTGPVYDFGQDPNGYNYIPYGLPEWQQPVAPELIVTVPEASSLLFMGFGLMVGLMFVL